MSRPLPEPPAAPPSAGGVSCLVPAYNEGVRIGRVLDALRGMSFLDEIIVLDDGSSDNTAEVVRARQAGHPALRLLASPANLGKTGIVQRGVEACRGDLVVILDADLLTLTPRHVRRLIAAVAEHGFDMAILDRAGDRRAFWWGWTNCARFFGGERAFRRRDFLEIAFPERAGFLLEIIMNLHYIRRRKKMQTLFCEDLFTLHDYKKRGVKAGFRHYRQIAGDILGHSGVVDFLKQVYHIEEDRLARLYRWHRKRYLKPATFILIPAVGLLYGWLTFLKLNFARIARPRRHQRVEPATSR